MFAALEMTDGSAEEITLHFDQGYVMLYAHLALVLETKYGVEEVFLAAFVAPAADGAAHEDVIGGRRNLGVARGLGALEDRLAPAGFFAAGADAGRYSPATPGPP